MESTNEQQTEQPVKRGRGRPKSSTPFNKADYMREYYREYMKDPEHISARNQSARRYYEKKKRQMEELLQFKIQVASLVI
jgi:hypothetical protein